MSEIDFTEALIREYAMKIYGFSYAQTNHTQDAEDLSQEIIAALCSVELEGKDIGCMDAYIYRICYYKWSRYLRRNKPQREALNHAGMLELRPCENSFEEHLLEKELKAKLRQEIMYLSKMKRDITVLFYYENMTGDQIAALLQTPASTVRWHLSKAKEDLKERVNMDHPQETIHKPIQLLVGHSGWVQSLDMSGLQSDVLMQNICLICYGKALTVEEIARTLGVAAVYLEDKIDKLLYMDYMKKVGTNKVQTNFFIRDRNYQIAEQTFLYEKTFQLASMLLQSMKECLDDIKKVGFTGADLDNDFLIYNLLPLLMNHWIDSARHEVVH